MHREHFGVRKTLTKVQQIFFWLNHRIDVEEWRRRLYGEKESEEEGERIYNVGAPWGGARHCRKRGEDPLEYSMLGQLLKG